MILRGVLALLRLFLLLFCLSADILPPKPQAGGSPQKYGEKKSDNAGFAQKSSDEGRAALSKTESANSTNLGRAEKIEIWVDNQSLHASDRNIGSSESPLRTITAAVRKAIREVGAGEAIIRVFPGIYRESVFVPNFVGGGKITIRGESAENTIISGGDLLAYWRECGTSPDGATLFSHDDIFPEQEKTGIFYVGKSRQTKTLADWPNPGEWLIRDGLLIWRPPTALDWKHAEIVAPVRPYPTENEITALFLISAGRLELESLTLNYSARAHAVVAVDGASEVTFRNLRLSSNLAPGFAVIGKSAGNKKCRILLDHVRIFGSSEDCFLSARNAEIILQDCVMDQSEGISNTSQNNKVPEPLIKISGDGALSISRTLFASSQKLARFDFASTDQIVLRSNTYLNSGGSIQFVFSHGNVTVEENFFLSDDQQAVGITIFEVNTPEIGFFPVLRGNTFQSHVFLHSAGGLFSQADVHPLPDSVFGGWRLEDNCLAEKCELEVVQTNPSIPAPGIHKPQQLQAKLLVNATKCDPERILQAVVSAREKLRLLRD